MPKKKGLKTPEYRRPTQPPAPCPAAPIDTITITAAEYACLQRQVALLDVIVNNTEYVASGVVLAVVETVKEMRKPDVVAGVDL